MPAKHKCPCPPEVYETGDSPAQIGRGTTQAAAIADAQTAPKMAIARDQALAAQAAALQAALALGDSACKPGTKNGCKKCEAWFHAAAPVGPFVRSVMGSGNQWQAAAVYGWTIFIKCVCPAEAVVKKTKR